MFHWYSFVTGQIGIYSEDGLLLDSLLLILQAVLFAGVSGGQNLPVHLINDFLWASA